MRIETRTAANLREAFREIPRSQRDANQGFSIRMWRAISWRERAESFDASDPEGRFISNWIGFNALYGRLDDEGKPWGDRESWGAFLAQVWRLDHEGRVRRILGKRENQIFKLIENRFVSSDFWETGTSALPKIKKQLKQAIVCYHTPRMLSVLQLLFERLYVMRIQVFHGASTKGGKLNRRVIQSSSTILLDLLPAMISIMIDHGVEEEWGTISFPPVE